jgi:acetylglutamate kinase
VSAQINVSEVTAKAKVLLEALPYIQDFRGSTFVVKYGGSFMDDPDPAVRARITYDIAFLSAVGINVVIVHGGGKAITKAMEQSGLKASFVKGLRVTDEATIAIVKKTLDEVVNRDVCDALSRRQREAEGPARRHRARLPEDVDRRGRQPARPRLRGRGDGGEGEAHQEGDRRRLRAGHLPGGRGLRRQALQRERRPRGRPVASALRARRLFYMSDVPGLLAAPPDPNSLISTLKISQVDELKKSGVIDKGMRPKVSSAVKALEEGVQRVHFIDGRLAHSLLLEIFTDKGIGTEIVHG